LLRHGTYGESRSENVRIIMPNYICQHLNIILQSKSVSPEVSPPLRLSNQNSEYNSETLVCATCAIQLIVLEMITLMKSGIYRLFRHL
jgi:hypothetical protein